MFKDLEYSYEVWLDKTYGVEVKVNKHTGLVSCLYTKYVDKDYEFPNIEVSHDLKKYGWQFQYHGKFYD